MSRPKMPRPTAGSNSMAAVAEPESAPPVEGDSAAQQAPFFAVALVLAFVFLRFSFLHEFLTAKLGVDTHILLLVGLGAVLGALFSGGFFVSFSNRICYAWFGFAILMGLATIASGWKGGSFAIVFPYFRTTLLLVLLIPAVTLTAKDLSKTLVVVGLSGLIPIAFGLFTKDYSSGRLELSGAGASIQNSNDFAALLILVLPAIAYATLRKNTNVILKTIGIGAIGIACYLILGTGSRGALISIMIATLFVFKAGSGKIRMLLLVALPLMALIVIPFLPGEAAQRLGSLFDSKTQTGESAESQQQRTALLKASLAISASHPLLGVGPGTFSIYQAQEAERNGGRGMWHETHNSYTQVSSECGIPALVFYLSAIVMTFLVFRRGMKSANPTTRGVSQILALMLLSFSVCMFFLSQAYGFGFPVLGGFAIALDRLLKREALTAAA